MQFRTAAEAGAWLAEDPSVEEKIKNHLSEEGIMRSMAFLQTCGAEELSEVGLMSLEVCRDERQKTIVSAMQVVAHAVRMSQSATYVRGK